MAKERNPYLMIFRQIFLKQLDYTQNIEMRREKCQRQIYAMTQALEIAIDDTLIHMVKMSAMPKGFKCRSLTSEKSPSQNVNQIRPWPSSSEQEYLNEFQKERFQYEAGNKEQNINIDQNLVGANNIQSQDQFERGSSRQRSRQKKKKKSHKTKKSKTKKQKKFQREPEEHIQQQSDQFRPPDNYNPILDPQPIPVSAVIKPLQTDAAQTEKQAIQPPNLSDKRTTRKRRK